MHLKKNTDILKNLSMLKMTNKKVQKAQNVKHLVKGTFDNVKLNDVKLDIQNNKVSEAPVLTKLSICKNKSVAKGKKDALTWIHNTFKKLSSESLIVIEKLFKFEALKRYPKLAKKYNDTLFMIDFNDYAPEHYTATILNAVFRALGYKHVLHKYRGMGVWKRVYENKAVKTNSKK